MFGLGAQELVIVLLIVLLLFGSARLPRLARSMREAKDEFQKANEPKSDDAAQSDAASEGSSQEKA